MALGGAGGDHGVVRLGALQVVHGQLCAGHVGLEHHGVVLQTCHHHFVVHEELGVEAAPAQFQAAGSDVRDVQLLCIWAGS